MSRALAERVFALLVIAAAAALAPSLRELPHESAIFPGALIAVIAVVAAVILLRGPRGVDSGERLLLHPPRFAIGLALLVAYLAGLQALGFFTASALLIAAVPVVLGYRRWTAIAPTAAIFLGAVWLVFVHVFQRPLPREFFLG